ncbi:MAG: phosphatidate cytidylyltransferase [Pseudomonadota bacterium]
MIGQRIVSALVIAAILLAAVFLLPARGLAALLSVVLLAAAWEWSAFVAGGRSALRWLFLAVALGLCILLWSGTASRAGLMACVVAGMLLWSLALLWLVVAPQRQNSAAVFIAGVIATSIAWVCLARISLDQPRGNLWILYSLLIVWVADSGAYFVGRSWGVSKLAPRISPGKTWAGLWGGLLASALLACVVAIALRLPMVQLVMLTIVVAGFSVIGDLTESLCKRFAGMKDSGTLIPGHGGVLDRFDSLLAAVPCLLFGLLTVPGLR